MNYFSESYKKFLAQHYVLDGWQFLENLQKNIVTAGYCFHIINSLITKMEKEHKEWQENINRTLLSQIEKEGKGEIGITYESLPQFNMDILGIPVDYPFLIDKYIKDFFQYLRNALDSTAQFLNSGLLANESKSIEWVDFNRIVNHLGKIPYSQVFPQTLLVLKRIQESSEFEYISEFNNKVKHISDSTVIMSRELFGDGTTTKIDSFYKKGVQFAEQDILTITKRVFDYVEKEFILLLDAATTEIEKDLFVSGRIHDLKFHVQMVKDDTENSFTTIFISVNESMNELPDNIKVMLVKVNDNVENLNSDYEEILIRDKEDRYIGKFVLEEEIHQDGLLHYRPYKKDNCDGIQAFIDHIRKNYSIKPMLMNGEIVRVGEND